jgi:outer membrane protein OmpA-like peptidoglycan-associated protein
MLNKVALKIIGLRIIICLMLIAGAAQQTSAQSRDTITILFPFDKAVLTSTAKEEMDQFVANYKLSSLSSPLIVRGHCDAIGSLDYNDQLSNRRVKAVLQYLLATGLPDTLIAAAHGLGEREPLNENRTAGQRQQNRRVEIIWSGTPVTVPATVQPVPVDTIPTLTQETIRTVEEGQTLRLRNINFYGGSHRFLPQSAPALKELLAIMKDNPTLVVEIQGHICCLPGSTRDGFDFDVNDYNLSHNRARAVYEYLRSNGISADRMSYKGFAGRVPLVYPEYTEEDRTTNRRVEIKIIRK